MLITATRTGSARQPQVPLPIRSLHFALSQVPFRLELVLDIVGFISRDGLSFFTAIFIRTKQSHDWHHWHRFLIRAARYYQVDWWWWEASQQPRPSSSCFPFFSQGKTIASPSLWKAGGLAFSKQQKRRGPLPFPSLAVQGCLDIEKRMEKGTKKGNLIEKSVSKIAQTMEVMWYQFYECLERLTIFWFIKRMKTVKS